MRLRMPLDNLISTTLEEQRHLVDYLVILGPVDLADAWSRATMNEVVETRPVIVACDGLGARPVGEQLLQKGQCLANTGRASEGAEVPGSVLPSPCA